MLLKLAAIAPATDPRLMGAARSPAPASIVAPSLSTVGKATWMSPLPPRAAAGSSAAVPLAMALSSRLPGRLLPLRCRFARGCTGGDSVGASAAAAAFCFRGGFRGVGVGSASDAGSAAAGLPVAMAAAAAAAQFEGAASGSSGELSARASCAARASLAAAYFAAAAARAALPSSRRICPV